MVEAQTTQTVEPTPEEEFGLVSGPLGHTANELMPEVFFNASLWEAFADRNARQIQPALAI